MEVEEEKLANTTSDVPENANEHCPGTKSNEAGKSNACAGCPNQSICASGALRQEDPFLPLVKEKLKSIKHKIFVLSGKGGVGKSTVSSQIAFMLSRAEKNVGLLDIDICGPSIPRMLGLEGREVHKSNEGWSPVYLEENLGVMSIGFLLENQDEAIVWRGPRKDGLIKQFLSDVCWGELDFLVIDTPPGTSDEHISSILYLQPSENDGAIIVTTPQEVALADVRKEINFCIKTKTKILGVIENMSGFVCPNCKCETQIFAPVTGGAEKMCKSLGLNYFGSIPIDPAVMLSSEKGVSIADKAPESKTAERYQEITMSLLEILKEIQHLTII